MSYYDEFARGSIYDDWLTVFPSVYDNVDFPDEAELPF